MDQGEAVSPLVSNYRWGETWKLARGWLTSSLCQCEGGTQQV